MTGSTYDGGADADADFFVSYTHSDERWAEWIGWVLEDAGYRVVMQAWDFGPGSHFVAEMHRAAERAARTVSVVSTAYQASVFTAEEWQAAWATDPGGRDRRLLMFRVENCPCDGLLRQVVSVDLFGTDRETARTRLLRAVRDERRKPETEPVFPSGSPASAKRSEPPLPRPPEVWRLPWPRNPNFVGRTKELAALRANFMTGSGIAAVLPQAMHGLGGVGKTQLAVEYAYRYATDYELVWWVPAEEPAVAVAALAELAARLGLDVPDKTQKSAVAVLELLRCGQRFRRWLMIADNASAVSGLRELLAAAGGNGDVLITSRDPAWSAMARPLEVDVLARSEAVALLRARAPRLTVAESEQIAQMLGDLPLAVEQAGAWLASSGMSAGDYVDAVQHRTVEILAEGKPAGYPVPVAATWTLDLDPIDEAAVWLLRYLAFLGPEPIPINLINSTTMQVLPDKLKPLADALARGRTVATLARLGLIRLVNDAVTMHRLVQVVLRDLTPAADRDMLRAAVQRVLAVAAPADTRDPASWPHWAVLHAHALATHIVQSNHDETRSFTLRLCDYLHNAGNHPASRALAKDAHRCWRQTLGDDHHDTITAAAYVASSLWQLGDYLAAREMQQDVLNRRQRVLGDDHPDTITAAADLAVTHGLLGDYVATREMQKDVLNRRQRVLGDNHPDTITAAADLAATLGLLGDHPAARKMQQDVLNRRQRVLGDNHPDTITAAADLAATLGLLGDHPAARKMQQDVLNRRQRVLGDDHPDTITAAADLAVTHGLLGDYVATREMQKDVLNRCRRVLGDDHPDTITAAADLALTLELLGDHPAAHEMQKDVLNRRQRVLGDGHPDTITAAACLAATLASLGDYPAAREIEQDVLDRRRRVLGDDHPDTITAAANLAVTLTWISDYAAARDLQQDVRDRGRRLLGDDHPDTITAAANLAVTLTWISDYPAARDLQQDVRDRRQRLLGDDHPDTITAVADLADTLVSMGDYPAAQDLQQDVLDRRQRLLGDDHPDTITAVADLADTLRLLGDHPDTPPGLRQ